MRTTVRCRDMKRSMVVYPIRHPSTTCTRMVFLNSTAYGRHMEKDTSDRRYQVSPAGVANDSGPQLGWGVKLYENCPLFRWNSPIAGARWLLRKEVRQYKGTTSARYRLCSTRYGMIR